MFKERFIQAIHSKSKVKITFYSKEDGSNLVRTCAPMDYGPSRRTKKKNDRFHFWDYDSDTQRHTLSLNLDQIINLEILDDFFDPAEFITWNTKQSPWFISREWGIYS